MTALIPSCMALIASALRFVIGMFILFLLSLSADAADRDSHGHIRRSGWARAEFKQLHPCPSTGRATGRCPGWIIDHVIPLACGGADAPRNMQWQTIAAAKAKDRWERIGCNQ